MTKHAPARRALPAAITVPGLIAVVGCDGTGKSTLTVDLVRHLKTKLSAERRYLGLISGEDGDKIKRLPVIGVALERRLAAKSAKTQSMASKAPALWAALIMYGLSVWRKGNLFKTLRLTERGVTVISDRYPQAEISGFYYDGPGIGPERVHGGLKARLAHRERLLYQQMALYRPQLIVRLNIDADTAFQRKPDHSYQELQDKVSTMAKLHFNGARILEIDARAPYEQVLQIALAEILAVIHSPL